MLSSLSLYQMNDSAVQKEVAHIFCAPDTLLVLKSDVNESRPLRTRVTSA